MRTLLSWPKDVDARHKAGHDRKTILCGWKIALAQTRRGGAQHQTGLGDNAALYDDRKPIDVGERIIGIGQIDHRHAVGRRVAVPIAELHPAPHHVGIGQRAAVVLATPDRNRRLCLLYTSDAADE